MFQLGPHSDHSHIFFSEIFRNQEIMRGVLLTDMKFQSKKISLSNYDLLIDWINMKIMLNCLLLSYYYCNYQSNNESSAIFLHQQQATHLEITDFHLQLQVFDGLFFFMIQFNVPNKKDCTFIFYFFFKKRLPSLAYETSPQKQ